MGTQRRELCMKMKRRPVNEKLGKREKGKGEEYGWGYNGIK